MGVKNNLNASFIIKQFTIFNSPRKREGLYLTDVGLVYTYILEIDRLPSATVNELEFYTTQLI